MRTLAVLQIRDWSFKSPVAAGDTIHVRSTVVEKETRARGRHRVVTWKREVINHTGKLVQEGISVTLVEGRAGQGKVDPEASVAEAARQDPV